MSSGKAKVINPFTGQVINEYDYISDDEVKRKIQESWDAFQKYKDTDSKTRSEKLRKLGDVFEKNLDKLAKTITQEMGKPIKESKSEVEKSIKQCRYFADHLHEYEKPDEIKTDAKKSYVVYEPLGPIYHITPFNFPFWLIIKGVIPAIAMGNTVLNKNPSSCPKIGILTEECFKEAGFNNGEYLNIIVGQKQSEAIISNKLIRGVSFTGSTSGGSHIASLAGKYCKKSVMELGGSDPFIVFADADLDHAVDQGVQSRLRNAGQACNCAKRLIIEESVYDKFKEKLLEKVKEMKVGDPMEEDTLIGPLAKKDGLEQTAEQVKKAKEQGGKVIYGGEQPKDDKLKNGFFYLPTIVEVEKGNILLNEETFGPVFALLKFKTEDEAIKIANDTEYGLDGAIFSKDEKRAEKLAKQVEAGAIYINHMVASGSELPSGGVKNSGFGREGGIYGAHEFVNIKCIYVGKEPDGSK